MPNKKTSASGRSRQQASKSAAWAKKKASDAEKKRKIKAKIKSDARAASRPTSHLEAKYGEGRLQRHKYLPSDGKLMPLDERGRFLVNPNSVRDRKAAAKGRMAARKRKANK